MDAVTLERAEWFAVARELGATFRDSAPAGLRSRIAALLNETPAGWTAQACTLELDAESAAVVRRIVRRGRGGSEHPGLERSQGEAVAEAVRFLRDDRAAAVGARYRVEHRSGGRVEVVSRTSDVEARQAGLSRHAARLMAAGATGELVLVEVATGRDLARRRLWPDAAPEGPPNR